MTIREFIELLSKESDLEKEIGFAKYLPPDANDVEILELAMCDGKYILNQRNSNDFDFKRLIVLYNLKEIWSK